MAAETISPAERVALEKASQYAGSQTAWTPENAPDVGLDPSKGFVARGTPIAPPTPAQATPYSPAQPSPLPEPPPTKPEAPWKQWTPLEAGDKPADKPASGGAQNQVQPKVWTPVDAGDKPVSGAPSASQKPWTPADAGDKPVQTQQGQQGQPPPQESTPPIPYPTIAQDQPSTEAQVGDLAAQIRAHIAQGKSPGEAQAIVAGEQPKTLNGKTPAPRSTKAPIGTLGDEALVQEIEAGPAQQPAKATSGFSYEKYAIPVDQGGYLKSDGTIDSQAVAADKAGKAAPQKAEQPSAQQPSKTGTGTTLRATWFGRNPDGSVDTTDEKTMSYYNAHHGAWGADLLDKSLVGIALSADSLRAHGVDTTKAPSSQGYKARVTTPDGKSAIVDIVDLGPHHTVDMTYGLGKKLGLSDNSQLQVSIIGPDGKEVALKDTGGGKGGGGGGGGGLVGGGGIGGLAQIPTSGGRPPAPEEAEANPPRGGGGGAESYGQWGYQGAAPRDRSFGWPPLWAMGAGSSEEEAPTRTLAKIPQEAPTEEPTDTAMKRANVLGVKTIEPPAAPALPPVPFSKIEAPTGPKALPAPPAPGIAIAAAAPKALDPIVIQGLMKRGFTRQQAESFAAKATVSAPGVSALTKGATFRPPAQPPPAPSAAKPSAQPPRPPAPPIKGGTPPGGTPPTPPRQGSALVQAAIAHAAALSPEDPRVKRQRDYKIKGEHFVPSDRFHEELLNGLPGGQGGRQRQILAQAEAAIADKAPMHISYISAPAEAALHPTRESRRIQYEESSPEARLMGTTEGQLVGHSFIPVSVGITPSRKAGEPHESVINGLSTNVLANNFHHVNRKLAEMGQNSPYAKLGAKFSSDLEGYLSNLNAGHTGTGHGHAVGTAEYPNTPDENHVPYKLTRREADFINTVINNTGAFAKHEDGQALRRLAQANGTLITPEGETNRMRHAIEQHEPGWRQNTLEPSIRTFKTGLIHDVHPSEEHMPATIRPGQEYRDLTEAIHRTSHYGRPDVGLSTSPRSQPAPAIPRDLAQNKQINQIEREFSEDKITEEQARHRLHAIGENPDEYRFVGGSGGLITPYEDNPEAITPEEHTQLKTNLRNQWIGGKMPIEDYRRKVAEVPLPELRSRAAPKATTPEPAAAAPPSKPKTTPSKPEEPETPAEKPEAPAQPAAAPPQPKKPAPTPQEEPEETLSEPPAAPSAETPLAKPKIATKVPAAIKKRIGERPEDEQQGKLHDRVAGRLGSEISGAIPLRPHRKATGEFRTDTKGNPLYEKEDYHLSNTPMLGKKALGFDEKGSVNKAPKGTTDKLDPDDLTYLNPTDRLRVSHLHEASAVQDYADKIEEYYNHVKDNVPAAMNFKDWYNDTEALLKKHFGKDSDLVANLLAATSAGTNVKVNYKLAMQAYHQFLNGDFDRHIDLYRKAYEMKQRDALAQHVFDQNIHHELPKSEAEAMARYLAHHDIVPRQTHGPLFGMNSLPVLKVLAHTWEQEVGGPKTPNYAGNMSGKTLQATADLWVARMMRRLGHEGINKKPWLIQPPAEGGLTNVDFGLSQLAFRKAAQKVGLEPRQLQAVLWGAEQKLYQDRGWEREIDPADRDYRPSLEKYQRPEWVKPSEEEQEPQARAA